MSRTITITKKNRNNVNADEDDENDENEEERRKDQKKRDRSSTSPLRVVNISLDELVEMSEEHQILISKQLGIKMEESELSRVDAIVEAQESDDWFPFVSVWDADTLSNERIFEQAQEESDLEDANIFSLLQWRDVVVKLSAVLFNAVSVTKTVLESLGDERVILEGREEELQTKFDRGEIRSRQNIIAMLGQDEESTAVKVFKAILDERDEELNEMEEEISNPSIGSLRSGKLKRHKKALETLSNEVIDLTVREGDEKEQAEMVIECQTVLRGWMQSSGLNARATHCQQQNAMSC